MNKYQDISMIKNCLKPQHQTTWICKMTVLFFLAFVCCFQLQAGVRLQKQGTTMQLVVNGKPMLLLAGELSNSAAPPLMTSRLL